MNTGSRCQVATGKDYGVAVDTGPCRNRDQFGWAGPSTLSSVRVVDGRRPAGRRRTRVGHRKTDNCQQRDVSDEHERPDACRGSRFAAARPSNQYRGSTSQHHDGDHTEAIRRDVRRVVDLAWIQSFGRGELNKPIGAPPHTGTTKLMIARAAKLAASSWFLRLAPGSSAARIARTTMGAITTKRRRWSQKELIPLSPRRYWANTRTLMRSGNFDTCRTTTRDCALSSVVCKATPACTTRPMQNVTTTTQVARVLRTNA